MSLGTNDPPWVLALTKQTSTFKYQHSVIVNLVITI